MSYKILTLSPGSTSTKVALFEDKKALFKDNIHHDAKDLGRFEKASDQLEWRTECVLRSLSDHGFSLNDIDAFSGYCGGMGPTIGGIFAIDDAVCNHVLTKGPNHPAILGAPILKKLADKVGKPAYAVNQPDTDELEDVARITGFPGVYRKSHVHCLNQKECASRAAVEVGSAYEKANIIVAHVGGGLSVACHHHGRMVDTNDVLEGSGPFAPNRSGDVPLKPVVALCYSDEKSKKEIDGVIGKTGGLKGLLGTDDAIEIGKRIEKGDKWAKIVYDAMAYQVAKAIGSFATVVHGNVDAIVLTGGVSNDKKFVAYVKERVSWIAPVLVYGGDFEMEGCAAGALRALTGEEKVMTFSGKPSWDGFSEKGAFADVERELHR